jgi:hypothetical protein
LEDTEGWSLVDTVGIADQQEREERDGQNGRRKKRKSRKHRTRKRTKLKRGDMQPMLNADGQTTGRNVP